MCTRTVLAKADIVLWRTGQTTFHLEAWRSFAAYVSGLLANRHEFYGDIQPRPDRRGAAGQDGDNPSLKMLACNRRSLR